ncbi:MAG: hypothetical protein Q8O76_10735 [Chloroflexota bacterium]|nr:hypothetical protein [Chloroflexota bacterium]
MDAVTMYCAGCRCGASAPVLFSDDYHFATPHSLIAAALAGKTNTHIGFYLGYSDHESPLKRRLAEELRRLGATSQAECPEPKCREAYRRGKEE